MVGKALLEDLGYSPEVRHNGQEAVEAVQQQAYDLVLMDCQMPVMSGLEATAQIRARESRREPIHPGRAPDYHIPIIALTANGYEDNQEACLAVGMDDFLSKPVEYSQIKGVLERWLL